MAQTRTWFAGVLAALLCCGIATPVTAVQAAPTQEGEPLVLVVSPKLDLRDLSESQVRRVFGGEAEYVGGKRLIPFNYKAGDPLRVAFDRVALGMDPAEVARYWVDRRVRGQPPAPRTVPSAAFMAAVAERLVGAIGYVPVDALNSKVRALTVNGRSYRDPNYPFRAQLNGGEG